MSKAPEPDDEIVISRPEVVHWWVTGFPHSHGFPNPSWPSDDRFVHHYLSELQFFDFTTKNGAAFSQATSDLASWNRVHDRDAFEAALRKQVGTEYIIAGAAEPIQVKKTGPGANGTKFIAAGGTPGAPAPTAGVWVIRKQDRIVQDRRPDPDNPFPETDILETYYIVGENVYKAPSVADVVENRMLGVMTSLNAFYTKARSLPRFSPTKGHTYLTDEGKKNGKDGVVDLAGADERSQRSSSVNPLQQDAPAAAAAAAAANDDDEAWQDGLIAQTLRMCGQYEGEYMDENPITGEPWNFKLTSTFNAVKKKRADEAAATAAEALKKQKEKEKAASSRTVLPQPFTSGNATKVKDRQLSKEERRKRRKSRQGTATSTPVSTSASASLG
ncbi:MED6-domain-containing protein [Piedraia hortae CBS 480.64]|uniref:Mediator of RNA polymerase II transcription subunit 6 n=1 Tax=Piedraia hortae CBS 480.64 TaxID=1314780 RepID=A0A6A7BV72_9PEZI|nr:MED6-domain-containing protein [Piedraia hortae CBS 480.64]